MMSILQPIGDALRGAQRKPTIILLGSCVTLLTWKYFATPEFLGELVDSRGGDPRVAGAIGHFVGCFLLLGLLPALTVKLVFRERLRDYGVSLGIARRTVRTGLFWSPVFLAAAYIASSDPQILSKFPINPLAGATPRMFAWHAVTYGLYYLGWEFCFRGFLLFGLRDAVGSVNAVLIQTLASALLHIGSPAAETFGAILAGLLWGALALHTRSLLSGLAQHYLLGIALDAFICAR